MWHALKLTLIIIFIFEPGAQLSICFSWPVASYPGAHIMVSTMKLRGSVTSTLHGVYHTHSREVPSTLETSIPCNNFIRIRLLPTVTLGGSDVEANGHLNYHAIRKQCVNVSAIATSS